MSYVGMSDASDDSIDTSQVPLQTNEYRSGQGEAVASEPLLGVVQPQDKPRVTVLKEASQLITGDREQDYGTPQVNFTRLAGLLNIIWERKLSEPLSPGDVALGLAALKMARAANGYQHDTAVDLAGYAALWAELNETLPEEKSE